MLCRRCVTERVLKNVGSVQALEGFEAIKVEDQAKVHAAFSRGSMDGIFAALPAKVRC